MTLGELVLAQFNFIGLILCLWTCLYNRYGTFYDGNQDGVDIYSKISKIEPAPYPNKYQHLVIVWLVALVDQSTTQLKYNLFGVEEYLLTL